MKTLRDQIQKAEQATNERLVERIRKATSSRHPFQTLEACTWRGEVLAANGCSRIEKILCGKDTQIKGFEDCILCQERKGMGKRGNKDKLPPCTFAVPGRKLRRSCRKITQFWRCTHPEGIKGQDLPRKHCETFCKYRKEP